MSEDEALKKEVIWRWAGSAAAPANWRLVRGLDIVLNMFREIFFFE